MEENYNQQSQTPIVPPTMPVDEDSRSNEVPPMKPKNWMVESILVTVLPFLFCCNIFALIGIVAIVNASKVNGLFYNKQYAEAEAVSKTAKKWVMITLFVAIAVLVLNIMLFATGVTKSLMENYMQTLESLSGGGSAY